MRTEFLLVCSLVSVGAAQDVPTPGPQGPFGIERDIFGSEFRNAEFVRQNSRVPEAFSAPSISAPAGTVSAKSLRHQIPKEARKAFDRAVKLSGKGEYAAAAHELETAVAKDPDFMEAHANLGAQYLRLSDLDHAMTKFQRAAELDPNVSAVHANLALAFLRKGDWTLAEKHARRAASLSDTGKNQLILGLLLIRVPETLSEGIEQLEKAARTIPAAKDVLAALQMPSAKR